MKDNITKMSVFKKLINRVYANLPKIPVGLFWLAIGNLILIFMWKCKRTNICKRVLNIKNKVGGLTLSDFKIYFKTAVIERVVLVSGSSYKSMEQKSNSRKGSTNL